MDKFAATLELLTPAELPHALRFVEVLERAGHVDADEAGEWRRRIEAWCRFRLRMESANVTVARADDAPRRSGSCSCRRLTAT